MNTRLSLTACCGFAALLLSAPCQVLAQPGFNAVDPNRVMLAPPKPVPETWKQKTLENFSFDGSPLGEVMQFLRREVPEINFVITAEAAEYALPPMELKSVTLEDAFTAIRIVSKGEIQVGPESATMVSVTRLDPGFRPQKPRKQCVAYSLQRYLQGKPEQAVEKALRDVEEALDQCWEMLGAANQMAYERPLLKVHPPTKMLIAVGETDQLQVIEQIVRQLEAASLPPGELVGRGGGLGSRFGSGLGGGGGYGGAMPGSPAGMTVAPEAPPIPPPAPSASRPSTNTPGPRK